MQGLQTSTVKDEGFRFEIKGPSINGDEGFRFEIKGASINGMFYLRGGDGARQDGFDLSSFPLDEG